MHGGNLEMSFWLQCGFFSFKEIQSLIVETDADRIS